MADNNLSIPSQVPLVDKNGRVTTPWLIWYNNLYARVGSSKALNNKELEEKNNENTENIGNVESQVNTNTEDISEINIVNQNQQNSIDILKDTTEAVQQELDNVNIRVENVEINILTIEERLNVDEQDIIDLKFKVIDNTNDITDIQNELDNLDLSGIETRLTNAENDITDLDTRTTTNTNDINTIETDLNNLEQRVTDDEQNLVILEDRVSDVEDKFSYVEESSFLIPSSAPSEKAKLYLLNNIFGTSNNLVYSDGTNYIDIIDEKNISDYISIRNDVSIIKGDLIGFNGTNYVRIPIGSNGQILTADSTSATGLRYISTPKVWKYHAFARANQGTEAVSTAGFPVNISGSGGVYNNFIITNNLEHQLDRVSFTAQNPNAVAGIRLLKKNLWRGSSSETNQNGGFKVEMRFGYYSASTASGNAQAFYAGLVDSENGGLSTATSAGIEPFSGSLKFIGLGCKSTDTSLYLRVYQSSIVDYTIPIAGLGTLIADDALKSGTPLLTYYKLTIECLGNGSALTITLQNIKFPNRIGSVTIANTSLPQQNLTFFPQVWNNNKTNSTGTMVFVDTDIYTDY